MSRKFFSRRVFLRGAGGFGIASPILSSLYASPGKVVSTNAPKRFIAIFSAVGQYAPFWYPAVNGQRGSLVDGAKISRLSDISGPISDTLGDRFSPFKDKINIIRGLDIIPLDVRDHLMGKMLSGYGHPSELHVSMDQILAKSNKIYPTPPRIRSLHLKAKGSGDDPISLANSTMSCAEINGVISRITPISSPKAAYEQLFFVPKNQLLMDHIKDEYRALANNPRLSKLDRERLEAHFSLLDGIDRRLSGTENVCGVQPLPSDNSCDDDCHFSEVISSQIELTAAAIKCDLTRVACLTLTEAAENRSYSFLKIPPQLANFHGTSHLRTPDSFEALRLIYRYHAQAVARLLELLDVVEDPETGKTYLDNSLVYWGGDCSVSFNGHGISNAHCCLDMPVFLAGAAGGSMKTGQYINYMRDGVRRQYKMSTCGDSPCVNDENFPFIGRPLNQLLNTLMTGMGLGSEEWDKTGAGFGDYSGDELGQYDLSDRQKTLSSIIAT